MAPPPRRLPAVDLRVAPRGARLALHVALDAGQSGLVVEALIAAFPDAAREKDERGRLPLLIAAEKDAPADTIAILLAAYPEAISETSGDVNGPYGIVQARSDYAHVLSDLTRVAAVGAGPRAARNRRRQLGD